MHYKLVEICSRVKSEDLTMLSAKQFEKLEDPLNFNIKYR